VLTKRQGKLDAQVVECMFLNYAESVKVKQLLDLSVFQDTKDLVVFLYTFVTFQLGTSLFFEPQE